MFYQLKAIRKKTVHPIWRRIYVPANITFAQLAVILEEILEYESSDRFEIEFYRKKERMAQWREDVNPLRDYYYSFLNAPDTYINEWMESEKSFAFRIRDEHIAYELPEYRVEIEAALEDITCTDSSGITRELYYPLIVKQVTEKVDPFWTDPRDINKHLKKNYVISEGEAKYPYTEDILAQIENGEGLSVSRELVNRNIHNALSAQARVRELAKRLSQTMDIPQEEKTAQTISKPGTRRSECKLEAYLKSYTKEDLQDLAEDLSLDLGGKKKASMAYEIARALLDGTTMRIRLLNLTEEELDFFEKVIENGPFVPKDNEQMLVDPIYALDYLCWYTDETVQIPDEVIALYGALKKSGYREFHRKAFWLLKCILVANYFYGSAPLDVVYRMYRQNRSIETNYRDFLEILDMIVPKMTDSIVAEDKLIQKTVYQTGLYKRLEMARRNIDHYIPDEQEIAVFYQDRYPSDDPAYQKLHEFFKKDLHFSDDYVKLLCSKVYPIFSGGGNISDIMNMLDKEEVKLQSEQQVRRFVELLMEVNNETRMVELNGHKPNEMARFQTVLPVREASYEPAQQRKTMKKIYPNDPCICGSGKKYKNCCGRNR